MRNNKNKKRHRSSLTKEGVYVRHCSVAARTIVTPAGVAAARQG